MQDTERDISKVLLIYKVILPNSQVPLSNVSVLMFSHYFKMCCRIQSDLLYKGNILKNKKVKAE